MNRLAYEDDDGDTPLINLTASVEADAGDGTPKGRPRSWWLGLKSRKTAIAAAAVLGIIFVVGIAVGLKRPASASHHGCDGNTALLNSAKEVLQNNWDSSMNSTLPNPSLYPHQWSWDSCYITIGYSRYDTQRGMQELRSLFTAQWLNGMLPHIRFNPDTPPGQYFPGPEFWQSITSSGGQAPRTINTSGIINPPVHPIAVEFLLDRSLMPLHVNYEYAAEMYPKLRKWMMYLYTERDPDRNHLVYIRHPWESGMDNSPLWDEIMNEVPFARDEIAPYPRLDLRRPGVNPLDRPSNWSYDRYVWLATNSRNHSYNESQIYNSVTQPHTFFMEDVLFNSIAARACLSMRWLASFLGLSPSAALSNLPSALRSAIQNGTEEDFWLQKHNYVVAALDTLFDGRGFKDQFTKNGTKVPTQAAGGLVAMFANATRHAGVLVDTLQNRSEFNTPFKVPTVAARSTSVCDAPSATAFSRNFSREYWRGPCWVNMNWLIINGLQQQTHVAGASKETQLLRENVCNFVVNNHGFNEYYSPCTGAAHGTSNFSWTAALFIDLFDNDE